VKLTRINLRYFSNNRNLEPCKRKNRPARRFFEGSQSSNSLNRGNWLLEGTVTKTCSFSLALTGA